MNCRLGRVPGFKSLGAGFRFRARALARSPHAGSASSRPARSVSCRRVCAAAAAAMGKTADSRGPGARPDPVRSFNRWKKKHSYKQSQKKQLRKQLKKPEWQVEREVISRLTQSYGKVRPARAGGAGRRAGCEGRGRAGRAGPGAVGRRSIGQVKGAGETRRGGPVDAPRVACRAPQPGLRAAPAAPPPPARFLINGWKCGGTGRAGGCTL